MSAQPDAGSTAAQAALSSPLRRRLLKFLRGDQTPHDAHELAAVVGLHVTTVRFHLNVLIRAGLVRGEAQPRGDTGRPRTVYQVVTHSEPEGYATLTRLLSAQLAATAPARAARAERAGVAWAAEVSTTGASRTGELSDQQVAQAVTGLFTELGFDPELQGDDGDREIRLHVCPFRTAARAHPEVVCSVHLGLLRGSLVQLGAPETTAELLPFVEPELCVARLGPSGGQ